MEQMLTVARVWKDIEALDFLYMDYKPPRPLNILISDEVLHKYQRIFAFILRLLRGEYPETLLSIPNTETTSSVESALKSVFRISRNTADPIFQNLPQSRQLFLHFRFIAQSFVGGLSSYVFDTAIAGNCDPFLARVSPPVAPKTRAPGSASASGRQTPVAPLERSTSSTVTTTSRSVQQMRSMSVSRRPPRRSTSIASRTTNFAGDPSISSGSATAAKSTSGFADVFELAQAHSSVLDDILSACLLRTGQKAVSELMRHSLEIVLEFCVVVGEVERKRMKEYEAAGVVEDLYTRLRGKMGSLVRHLYY